MIRPVCCLFVAARSDEGISAALVPFLVHGEIGPGRGAERELAVAVHRRQMIVGVPLADQPAHLVHPRLVAEQVVLVGHVPHDVREGGTAGHGVAVVPLFVLAAHARLAERIDSRPATVDVEDDRDDHVQLAGVAQQAVVLLPVRHVETRHVKARILDARWTCGDPGVQQERELVRRIHVLRPGLPVFHAAHDHNSDTIDLQPVQPVQALANGLVVPAHQPIGGRAVPEVMLTRPSPDEVPGVLAIDSHQPAATGIAGRERACMVRLEVSLSVSDRVPMQTPCGRHEADAEHAAILGIAEPVHLNRFAFLASGIRPPTTASVNGFATVGRRTLIVTSTKSCTSTTAADSRKVTPADRPTAAGSAAQAM